MESSSSSPSYIPLEQIVPQDGLQDDQHDGKQVVERAKESYRENLGKLSVAFLGFILLGLGDASLGPLIPLLEDYYKIDDLVMSIAFLAPFLGFNISAFTNGWLHTKIGLGGVSLTASALQFSFFLIASFQPSYAILIASYSFYGLGNGLIDASWNAWIADFHSAHEILGLLHGFYGLGGLLGPMVITALIRYNLEWRVFYWIMMGFSVLMIALVFIFFRKETAAKYILSTMETKIVEDDDEGRDPEAVEYVSSGSTGTIEALKTFQVWIFALILFLYVGLEVGIGGWIVTFMIRERQGDPKSMGLVASGFWSGLTAGRMILGFVTGKFRNHHRILIVYLLLAIACHVGFSFSHSVIGSAIFIALEGFFIGPVFPSAMVHATSVFPKRIHVAAIGTAAAFAASGAALFPFLTGVLISKFGITVLKPVFMLLLISITAFWTFGIKAAN